MKSKKLKAKRPVVLIKLGGSIITNKEVPMELRSEVLARLVQEIHQAQLAQPDTLLVVGHGSGSFGHVPASQYGTMNGFTDSQSAYGMAVVQDSAAQLNRLVVRSFLNAGMPAVSLLPSNSLVTDRRKLQNCFTDVFLEYLKQGLFPVTQGDVIVDRQQGCTIWSTEEVLSFLAAELTNHGWPVKQIIHVTEVPGVFNQEGQIVTSITPQTWPQLQSAIQTTKGYDVTGGMALKVAESLALAQKGIRAKIVSGLEPSNLYHALLNKNWKGTEIHA